MRQAVHARLREGVNPWNALDSVVVFLDARAFAWPASRTRFVPNSRALDRCRSSKLWLWLRLRARVRDRGRAPRAGAGGLSRGSDRRRTHRGGAQAPRPRCSARLRPGCAPSLRSTTSPADWAARSGHPPIRPLPTLIVSPTSPLRDQTASRSFGWIRPVLISSVHRGPAGAGARTTARLATAHYDILLLPIDIQPTNSWTRLSSTAVKKSPWLHPKRFLKSVVHNRENRPRRRSC